MTDNRPHILIVDDELSMRQLLEYMLTREGYDVTCAENGRKGVSLVEHNSYDLLLCDIRLGDISGLDVLKACKKHHPGTVVIMISAYSTTEAAVDAMNQGAYDYVPKPFNNDELLETLAKALKLRTVEQEKETLGDQLKQNLHFGTIVGNSPPMQHIYKMIVQLAKTKTNVLITGESGTGKELIARAIHQGKRSPRSSFCRHQLRRDPRNPDGKRALRPQERLVYGGRPGQTRLFPAGPPGDYFPR